MFVFVRKRKQDFYFRPLRHMLIVEIRTPPNYKYRHRRPCRFPIFLFSLSSFHQILEVFYFKKNLHLTFISSRPVSHITFFSTSIQLYINLVHPTMVALTSHFQLFTTVYVLATTLLVDGAAVPARHMVKSSKLFAQTLPPVLPLPPAAIKNQNAEGVEGNTEKKFGPGKQQHKRVSHAIRPCSLNKTLLQKLSHLETRTNNRSNIGRRHNDRRENNDQTHRDSDHLKVGHSSSIVLSGGSYVISPSYARRSNRNNQQVLEVKGDHVHKHMTRDSNTTETIGMPGTIDVMVIIFIQPIIRADTNDSSTRLLDNPLLLSDFRGSRQAIQLS